MLARCLKWRIEENVMGLLAEGDAGISKRDPKYREQGESGKVFCVGLSQSIKPVVYINVAKHLTKGQSAETMTKFVITTAESFRTLIVQPHDKVIIVFNLTGFGFKNLDWHTLLLIVQVLESFYPETLSKLYMHKAPWIFQGVWKVLAPMLDPAVRDKISFSNKPSDFEDIPMSRLPEYLGGELDYEYKFIPPNDSEERVLPENDPKFKQVRDAYMSMAAKYEKVTKQWIDSQGQDDSLNEKRQEIARKIRLIYFELGPMVMASNMYHRMGVIHPDGKKVWEYKQKNGQVIEQVYGEELSRPALEEKYGSPFGQSDGAGSGPASGAATPSGQKQPKSKSSGGGAAAGAVAGAGAGAAGVGAAAASAGGLRSKQSAASMDGLANGGNTVYTAGNSGGYQSSEDLFVDATQDGSTQGSAGGAGSKSRQRDATNSGKNAFSAVTPPQEETAAKTDSKDAMGIPGTAHVDNEQDSPLAGFPERGGSEGIAKRNEHIQVENEKIERKKNSSLLSRLNCFKNDKVK